MGAKPPPIDQGNLWISVGFRDKKGAEPPPPAKKCKPDPGKIPDYAPGTKLKIA